MPTPFQFLIDEFCTVKNLAEALKLHRSTIYRWDKEGIPRRRIIEIERLTKYKLKRQQLRPDLYSDES